MAARPIRAGRSTSCTDNQRGSICSDFSVSVLPMFTVESSTLDLCKYAPVCFVLFLLLSEQSCKRMFVASAAGTELCCVDRERMRA